MRSTLQVDSYVVVEWSVLIAVSRSPAVSGMDAINKATLGEFYGLAAGGHIVVT
ncbi:MAG TPA: hypothetical protein VNR66_16870 [Solirubrobacteraceae bacterium]|nr:hypothetical protein [Solirubrobacteraceae bacterium]